MQKWKVVGAVGDLESQQQDRQYVCEYDSNVNC